MNHFYFNESNTAVMVLIFESFTVKLRVDTRLNKKTAIVDPEKVEGHNRVNWGKNHVFHIIAKAAGKWFRTIRFESFEWSVLVVLEKPISDGPPHHHDSAWRTFRSLSKKYSTSCQGTLKSTHTDFIKVIVYIQWLGYCGNTPGDTWEYLGPHFP